MMETSFKQSTLYNYKILFYSSKIEVKSIKSVELNCKENTTNNSTKITQNLEDVMTAILAAIPSSNTKYNKE